ncbi:HdeD family acid-resistance protein [Microvirga sp. TS319]|uniref:HdeD family acid-resistance protein n=1 Tax=Microvirga sp. TS319 TaxID=3241165 RepID=UPI00351A11AD
MAARDAVSLSRTRNTQTPPGWVRLMLGLVMVLAGVAILADVAFASLVSSAFIGATAVVVGLCEIVHAVWTRREGAVPWQILLGLLYVAVGIVLVADIGSGDMIAASGIARSARSSELLLTYGLGLLLLASGIVRILLGVRRWRAGGWMLLLAGTFGVVAGLIVLTEFPKTGFWIFGLLLGIDLIVHGAAWLGFAFLGSGRPRHAGSGVAR